MYHFFKNATLQMWFIVMGLGLFVWQLDALSRAYQMKPKRYQFTPEQLAAKKIYFDQLNKPQMKKSIENQALLLQPDKLLIYEEDTYYYLIIPREIAMLSGTIRDMVENLPDARTIPIRYPISALKEVI